VRTAPDALCDVPSAAVMVAVKLRVLRSQRHGAARSTLAVPEGPSVTVATGPGPAPSFSVTAATAPGGPLTRKETHPV
jgi:hypothetical protein